MVLEYLSTTFLGNFVTFDWYIWDFNDHVRSVLAPQSTQLTIHNPSKGVSISTSPHLVAKGQFYFYLWTQPQPATTCFLTQSLAHVRSL